MDKKQLKFYEVPACEVMELNLEHFICASQIEGVENVDDLTGGNDNPGF